MTQELPEDVKAAAQAAYDAYANGAGRDIRDAIGGAILAERHRCAQIADARAKKSLADIGGDESFYWEGSASAAQIIAAAIRGEGNGEG